LPFLSNALKSFHKLQGRILDCKINWGSFGWCSLFIPDFTNNIGKIAFDLFIQYSTCLITITYLSLNHTLQKFRWEQRYILCIPVFWFVVSIFHAWYHCTIPCIISSYWVMIHISCWKLFILFHDQILNSVTLFFLSTNYVQYFCKLWLWRRFDTISFMHKMWKSWNIFMVGWIIPSLNQIFIYIWLLQIHLLSSIHGSSHINNEIFIYPIHWYRYERWQTSHRHSVFQRNQDPWLFVRWQNPIYRTNVHIR